MLPKAKPRLKQAGKGAASKKKVRMTIRRIKRMPFVLLFIAE